MHAISQRGAPPETVRSLTLAEYVSPPSARYQPAQRSFFGRVAALVKTALIAWAVISFGAIAGVGAYYLNDGSDTPLLVSESRSKPTRLAAAVAVPAAAHAKVAAAPVIAPPAATPTSAAPPRDRLAALVDYSSASLYAPPDGLTQALMLRAPAPIAAARLPRPRPDEPIYTGSIRAPAYDRPSAGPRRRVRFDPCAALRNLGAPFLFGNRCGHYTRVYPPPPRQFNRAATSAAAPPPPALQAAPLPARQYAPQPYQPPVPIQP